MITFLFILFAVAYSFWIAFLVIGWKKNQSNKNNSYSVEKSQITASVVIPCRNEAHRLPALLQQFNEMSLSNPAEIIVVDDHSDDNTIDIIRSYPNVRFVKLKSGIEGKKHAIEKGVEIASGEVILITDADCIHPPYWIKNMLSPFYNPDVMLVAGGVVMKLNKNIFFQKLFSLEFSTLVASSVSMAGWNKPILCNGANMAYRKKTFISMGGYAGDNAASGDDVLLLHRIKKIMGPQAIHYLMSENVLVKTSPAESLNEFWSQRKRWAKKSLYYKDKDALIISFVVMLIQILPWIFLVMSFLHKDFISVFLGMLLVKAMMDAAYFFTFSKTMKLSHHIGYVLILSCIHWIYIPCIAIASFTSSTIVWKGRKIKY
jgi:cellulose synthase/poly-beta-1,6-N-acetylglucosamine synthase-like glycosyltransferase